MLYFQLETLEMHVVICYWNIGITNSVIISTLMLILLSVVGDLVSWTSEPKLWQDLAYTISLELSFVNEVNNTTRMS